MSYFRVQPSALQMQSEALESIYHSYCQMVAELDGVVRSLGTMDGFDGVIENLHHVQQTESGQQMKLRRCAQVLGRLAELYITMETKNLDGGGNCVRRMPVSIQADSSFLRKDAAEGWKVLQPVPMLPFAEELFGTPAI